MYTASVIENVLTPAETKLVSDRYMSGYDITDDLLSTGDAALFRQFVDSVYSQEILLASIRRMPNHEVSIQHVTGQPYVSADDMRSQFESTGVLKISTDFNDSALLGPAINLKFRAAHDLHHIRTQDCGFFLDGEICAFSKFADYAQSNLYRLILFSEIVGQVCALRHWGKGKDFAPQKVVLLPGEIMQKCLVAYEVK